MICLLVLLLFGITIVYKDNYYDGMCWKTLMTIRRMMMMATSLSLMVTMISRSGRVESVDFLSDLFWRILIMQIPNHTQLQYLSLQVPNTMWCGSNHTQPPFLIHSLWLSRNYVIADVGWALEQSGRCRRSRVALIENFQNEQRYFALTYTILSIYALLARFVANFLFVFLIIVDIFVCF